MSTFPLDYKSMRDFWFKVDMSGPEGCWPWTKSKTSAGYGDFRLNNKHYYAHRTAYEILIGKIPENLVIDHLCNNPPCTNPYHMQPKTIGDNVRRAGLNGASKTNSEKTKCIRGHALTPDNLMSSVGRRTCKSVPKLDVISIELITKAGDATMTVYGWD